MNRAKGVPDSNKLIFRGFRVTTPMEKRSPTDVFYNFARPGNLLETISFELEGSRTTTHSNN